MEFSRLFIPSFAHICACSARARWRLLSGCEDEQAKACVVKGSTGRRDHKRACHGPDCELQEVTTRTVASKRGGVVWAKPRCGAMKTGRHKCLLFWKSTCCSKWNIWHYNRLKLKKKKKKVGQCGGKYFGFALPKAALRDGLAWHTILAFSCSSL